MTEVDVSTILVVDDEEYLRRLVMRLLTEQGYACAQAASAPEALDMLGSHEFSLVVSDIMMPGMSGVELLAAVKQRHPAVAMIMLTGVDNTDIAIQALEIGAYGYIIKPYQANELLINVANALRRRNLEMLRDEYEQRLEREVNDRTMEIRKTQEEVTIRLVTAAEYRDEETGAHIKRMGHYAALLAQSLEWDARAVEDMRLAAPMHDIGKIGIPDGILMKPGKLTNEEFELIKVHTTIGAQILHGSEFPVLRMAYEIALSHHEHIDGSGYPQGLRGAAIPLAARIVAVCDVFDALTTNRVYRLALPEDQALAIMREDQGRQFDEDIFARFLTLLPKFYAIRRAFIDSEV